MMVATIVGTQRPSTAAHSERNVPNGFAEITICHYFAVDLHLGEWCLSKQCADRRSGVGALLCDFRTMEWLLTDPDGPVKLKPLQSRRFQLPPQHGLADPCVALSRPHPG